MLVAVLDLVAHAFMHLGSGPGAALDAGGQVLPQDTNGDVLVAGGLQIFVKARAGRLAGRFNRLGAAALGNHQHGILDGSFELVGKIIDLRLAGLGRMFANDPGRTEFFDEPQPEFEAALFERDRPEAAGEHTLAVGVVVGCVVPGQQEFFLRERLALDEVGPSPHAQLIVRAEHEPLHRLGVHLARHDGAAVPRPHDLQGLHPEQGGIEDLADDLVDLELGQALAHELGMGGRGIAPGDRPLQADDRRPAGLHARPHAGIREQLLVDPDVLAELAQDRVRVGQGHGQAEKVRASFPGGDLLEERSRSPVDGVEIEGAGPDAACGHGVVLS
ncbi:hypothetical protein DSECCO2_641840 [anaerobic digester metagenome]